MNHSNKSYWLLSGAFFTFFCCWSFCFSLFPIWLNQVIGLSGELTGVVFSCNAIVALLVMPFYGYLQDKLVLKKHLLLFIAFLLVAVGPFFIFIYTPLLLSHFYVGALFGGLFLTAAFGAGIGALESYVERVARNNSFEFGRARMWGSLGWATATFCAGYLFNIDPHINFWLASFSAIIFLVLIAMLKPINFQQTISSESADTHKKFDLKLMMSLLLMKKFWTFVVFVTGVTCVYTVYDQQFAVYFASQFSDQQLGNVMYGYLNALQVLLEAGGMFIAPALVNKIGAKNGLIVSGFIMSARIIGSGFADDAITLSLMKLLHAAELPFLLVAIFKYIAHTFDSRMSATLYIVGFQFCTQLLASGLSLIAGLLYDSIGFSKAYFILGLVVLVFTCISHFLLIADSKQGVSHPAYAQ